MAKVYDEHGVECGTSRQIVTSVIPLYNVEVCCPGERTQFAQIHAANTEDLFRKLIAGAFLVPRHSEGSLTISWVDR